MNQETFEQQYAEFARQSALDGRFTFVDRTQILNDDKPAHDELDCSHDYLWHTAWAARKIAAKIPSIHYDFGSYVYFAALCSAFVPNFVFCDIRPVSFPLPGLQQFRADLTNLEGATDSIPSISCLHVLEHCGLGRYGDKIDASGDLKAAAELTRILAPGGQLIMVLPMNENPRVFFNAHRFYSALQVHQMFSGLKMVDHACIFNGCLVENLMAPQDVDYTGCMVFTK